MPHMREVKTCDRCRNYKRRCDLLKPSCTRCRQAGVACSFAANAAGGQQLVSTIGAAPVPAVALSPGSVLVLNQGRPANVLAPGQTLAASSTTSTPPSILNRPHLAISPEVANGLITPTTSTESPEPLADSSAPLLGVAQLEAGAAADTLSDGAATSAAQRVVRKRKRNCLSCLRCHRLKVKCDKELPCGRCKSSGNARECYYSYNKGANGGKFPCPTAQAAGDDSKAVHATWQIHHKVRGSSHWRDLITKIAALAKGGSQLLEAALESVATNACLANFNLPGNFPFGTPGATKYAARDPVTRLIESERANCQTYIDVYVNLLDCVNPVLDMARFHAEVEQYWRDPGAVSPCWLSQFLMVLGLGCFSRTKDEPQVAIELMMAAEACLMQTPFTFRPTLMMLKTLTLMVVAKQVCNATCWSVDSCWSLLGLLVRLAFIHGLPQDRVDDTDGDDSEERDARRKLWLTILYIDTRVSMCTGMPPQTRPDELQMSSLRTMPDWGQPDSLQMVLYQSLPTVLSVLAQTNSKQDQVPYPDVMRYSAQLRDLMAHAQRVCPEQLQRITVDIFLRRCLMVLHRPFALHPEGPVMFPESYWSSLECSLAILMHFRELWSPESALRLDLVGRGFVLEFFSACLTALLHVLREDAPLAGAAATGCNIPPRQIILDLLRSCVDIWEGECEKSVCYRTGYEILQAVIKMLPGSA